VTLLLIDVKVGPNAAPDFSAVMFQSPWRLVNGATVTYPTPAPVVLDEYGQGSVTIDPGVWIVKIVTPLETFTEARVVPDQDSVNLSECELVTDRESIGFVPEYLARADRSLAAAFAALNKVTASSARVDDWLAERTEIPLIQTGDPVIRLPEAFNEIVKIGGTGDIRDIEARGYGGRQVTFIFIQDKPGRVIMDRLKIAGDFQPRFRDTITLVCDGLMWYEVARSRYAVGDSTTPTLPPEIPGAIDGGKGETVTVSDELDGGTASSAATDEVTVEGAVTVLQVRRMTAAQWATSTYVLSDSEIGWDSTNRVLKLGDGEKLWSGLPRQTYRGPIGRRGDKGRTGDKGPTGEDGVEGATGATGAPGLPGLGNSSLTRIPPTRPIPATASFGIILREGYSASAPPPTTTDPGTGNPTPEEPDYDPGTQPTNPPAGSVIVPQSQRGPSRVDYTPKTLARTEKADKTYTAASLSQTDIKAAITSALGWMDANPTKWCDVILPDGQLYGFGGGSTSTPFLRDLGSATGTSGHRIRVRPGGNYGAVEIATARPGQQDTYDNLGNLVGTASLLFRNVNGITFSEIYGNEAAIVIAGCSDFGMEYSHDLAYWGVNAVEGIPSSNVDLTSLVYGKARVKNGDAAGITTLSGGSLNEVHLRTLYMAPIRIGPRSSWGLKNGVPQKPHSDLIQVKGNTQVPVLTCSNSYLCACANCIFQFGGNSRLFSEDNWLIGEYDSLLQLFPSPQEFYPPDNPPATFQVFNGDGLGGHVARRTYAQGSMGGAAWAIPAADKATALAVSGSAPAGWTVNAARKSLAELSAVKPPNGFEMWKSRA
jgi:hypothetical protein